MKLFLITDLLNINLLKEGETETLPDVSLNNDAFILANAENLTWGQSNLSLTENPYKSGDIVQNSKGAARDITLELKPLKNRGDYTSLYNKLALSVGRVVTLVQRDAKVSETETDEISIGGIITEFEAPRIGTDLRCTLTIHCSNPYWYGTLIENAESTNGKLTVKGTAPTKLDVVIPNAVIPKKEIITDAYGGQSITGLYLYARNIGDADSWRFNYTSDLSNWGDLTVLTGNWNSFRKGISITLGSTGIGLALLDSPLHGLVGDVYCKTLTNNGTLTPLEFTATYCPAYY